MVWSRWSLLQNGQWIQPNSMLVLVWSSWQLQMWLHAHLSHSDRKNLRRKRYSQHANEAEIRPSQIFMEFWSTTTALHKVFMTGRKRGDFQPKSQFSKSQNQQRISSIPPTIHIKTYFWHLPLFLYSAYSDLILLSSSHVQFFQERDHFSMSYENTIFSSVKNTYHLK